MRILLTGCAGFIGSRVTSLLLESGHWVAGVDNLSSSTDSLLKEWRLNALRPHPKFTFHRLDISNEKALAPVFRAGIESGPVSAVFNLGALAGVRR